MDLPPRPQEEVVRVKYSVAQVLVGLTVKIVGATLGAEVDDAAREASPLCTQIAGLNLELLNGILRRY